MFSGLHCKPAILGLSQQHGSLKHRFEFSPGRADPYLDINLKDPELCILYETVYNCASGAEKNQVNEEKNTGPGGPFGVRSCPLSVASPCQSHLGR